jgi:hypothetical protein
MLCRWKRDAMPMEARCYADGSAMLCRWKRDAMPMEARCYADGSAMLCRHNQQKKKTTLRQPFPSLSIWGVSVLDPLPVGLFFTLTAGFNLGVFEDVQAF